VKSRQTWNHSLDVSETALSIGRAMGLGAAELSRLKRSALVHDLGKAAVPVGILDKDHNFSAADWERFRLHTYYTARVLTRVGPLAELAGPAASHHERMDGDGYHRKLSRDQIPAAGRILGVADAFAVGLRGSGGDAERALAAVRSRAGNELDPSCCEGLEAAL